MSKFSVVIPTMGKYPAIWDFVEDLCQFDVVDEVVVIDNCLGDEIDEVHPRLYQHSKMRWEGASYGNPLNIGCNASWNKGIFLARNENVCIANDDIIWDIRGLYRVEEFLSERIPLIGMCAGDPVHSQPPITDGKIDVTEWNYNIHTHGFGCLFFVRKSWWVPIPDGLFNYFGDNWVFDTTLKRGKTPHLLTNFMYHTPFAQTMKDCPEKEAMLLREHKIYQEKIRTWNP